MTRDIVDYEIVLSNQRDLEEFANAVKDAVVANIALSERFSSVRLRTASMTINDFMPSGMRGHATDHAFELTQRTSALQLAGTCVHELAHVLVGVVNQHNADWSDGARALGLTHVDAAGQDYKPEHFAPPILAAIRSALAELARRFPTMFFDPKIEIPLPTGRELLAFQTANVRKMLEINNKGKHILLADEPGLGKTVQTLAFINVTHPKKVLVVCPNSLTRVWRQHFQDFCIWPDLIEDLEIASSSLYMFSDVVIMNYEATLKWGLALQKTDWDLIVFDEMHYLKNPSAKRSKVCYKFRANRAIGITATPIVNYWYEAFPLLHYLDRENWPEFARAEVQYGSAGKFGRNLNRFNALLRATIMVRNLKKDVLKDLPRKRRQVIEFEADDSTKQLIEKEKKLFASLSGDDAAGNAFLLNKLMSEAKQEGGSEDSDEEWAALIEALASTKRFAFEEMARIAHLIALAKIPLAIEHIENALENREKVIVFGHHRDVLEAIANRFAKESVLLLGGNLNQSGALESATRRFNEDENCRVFVTNLAEGYSLRGSSVEIFIEQFWRPSDYEQRENRAHGINRGDADAASLLIQHLTFEDSLDTYKAKLQTKKKRSIDRALGATR